MKERFILNALIVCLAFCSQAFVPAVANSHPSFSLTLTTAASTGTLTPLAIALAHIWNSRLPHVSVRMQSTRGGVENLHRLKAGTAQIVFATTNIASDAMLGSRDFKNRANPNIRVLAGLYYNVNQVLARGDTTINTLADFMGTSFAAGAVGGTSEIEARAHFTKAGLPWPQNFRLHFADFTQSIELMRNKQLEGAWIMTGVPASAVTTICADGGRLVSLDDELISSMCAAFPWYVAHSIPAGTYPNQNTPVQSTAIKMLLLTDASLPDTLAYELTKSLWENVDSLSASQPVMEEVHLGMAVSHLADIPLHPGAAQYYKEAGLVPSP